MAKPLSMDLRNHVLACIGGGVSGRQAAERCGVNAARVSRWRTRERPIGLSISSLFTRYCRWVLGAVNQSLNWRPGALSNISIRAP
jgi:hypothetical protein